ncbi:MAG TPA: hypothetical protein VI670_22100 [Thermoanaerobaculia bacterium]
MLLTKARQGALKHQPVETREDPDDLLLVTLDQVRHRPTIPPTVPVTFFLGFGYAEVGKPPLPSLLFVKSIRFDVSRIKLI